MGLAAAYREGTTLSPEGVLYRCENPVLDDALQQTQSLYRDMVQDARENNEDIDPFEAGIRLQESGIWAVKYSPDMYDDEAAALRLLTAASHFGDVQHDIDTIRMPEHEYAPRVHNNCVYNGVTQDFGELVPKAKLAEVRRVMLMTRWILGHEGNQDRIENIYRRTIHGGLVERWGRFMIGTTWSIDRAGTLLDLMGVDALMQTRKKSDEAICIDFASSKDTVRRKCGSGAHSSGWWGVRDGVVVLWPGVTGRDMGDTFEIHEKVARPIFKKSVKDIIISALKSKDVKRVAWKT